MTKDKTKQAAVLHEGWLVAQRRVFLALLLRETTTRFGRSAGGYLWALLEPAGAVALLTLVFSQISHKPPLGDNFAVFFATGYLVFHTYGDISRNVSMSVKVNKPLLSFPRVSMLDTVVARFALQLLTAVFAGIVILTGLLLVTGADVGLRLERIGAAVAMAALLGLGVGAVNCVLFAFLPTWERFFMIVNRPMFIISGVFFIYEGLPAGAQAIIWWNPLVHVTGIARSGFYPFYQADFASPLYVMTVSLTLLMAGVLLLRLLRHRMLEQL